MEGTSLEVFDTPSRDYHCSILMDQEEKGRECYYGYFVTSSHRRCMYPEPFRLDKQGAGLSECL